MLSLNEQCHSKGKAKPVHLVCSGRMLALARRRVWPPELVEAVSNMESRTPGQAAEGPS